MALTTPLTIPMTAFGTVTCAGQTLTYVPNSSTNIFTPTVTIGTSYTITYTPYDATTKFSRFDPAYGDVSITGLSVNSTTGVATATVTVNNSSPPAAFPFVVVYVKMPFYVQVYGDGRIDLTSNNPEDTGTLTASGYMAINSAFFEVDWAVGDQHTFTALYTPPAGPSGYSFGSWIENPGGDPTSNPITFPSATNDSAQALGPLTNINISVTSSAGGSVASSPAGISITGAGTDTGPFPYATQLVLTATPAAGYKFSHWADSSPQTNNPSINIWVQAPYSINAIFTQNTPPETDIVQLSARDYVPSQGERADAQHICQCPCACTGCSPAFTSALNRTRQIRALISGSCCQHIPVGVTFNTGGAGYAVGDLVQLKGGVPLEKPALFKVISVDGSGQITDLKLIYGQPYRVQPVDDVLVPYTGLGNGGGDFAIIWSSCLSPANLYRQ